MKAHSMTNTNTLPFPALVGLELAQQALLLLAIDPQLRGVVLAAAAGTGKSSLARGMQALLTSDDTETQTPFVELPPSVDVENLLGGLDLEATLRTGKVVMQRGVLARADGGVVYVDGINLLTDATANLLLSVVDEGVLQIERDGVSQRITTRFSLIGSYDPNEGLPRRHLLDRIGLIAQLPPAEDATQRARVIRHNLHSAGYDADWQEEMRFLRGIVQAARQHLPTVTISAAQVQRLSQIALAYGVEGHRVDVFAVRAALAAAAYDLADEVDDDALQLAAQLVILPRATRIPSQEAQDELQQTPQQQDQPEPPPQNDTPDQPDEPDEPDEPDDEQDPEAAPEAVGLPPEQILEALAASLPDSLDALPFQHLRRGRSGSRGTTEGTRGRHVRSIPGDPRRNRLDVVATLRGAAPWQRVRRPKRARKSQRKRVYLQLSDVRVKQYRSKAGALFCFAVDASGSMAIHRMRQAKGAVNTLLERAYVNRDRVALISFRGEQADVLMPPTQSMELARRALDLLPTGGGTPLASALLLANDVAEQAASRGIMQTILILLTDGRANVGLKPDADVNQELQQLGRFVAESRLQVVVVDTKRSYLSQGEAQRLASWLGADYAYLPNASGEQIGEMVANMPG